MAEGKGTSQIVMIVQLFFIIMVGMMLGKLISVFLRETFRIPICCGPVPPEKT